MAPAIDTTLFHMPRENSFTDSEGRSLTPDMEDEEFERRIPIHSPNAHFPLHVTEPSPRLAHASNPRSPSKRSILSKLKSPTSQTSTKSPTTHRGHTWVPSNVPPKERFRAAVRKVMALHRGTSYLAGASRVGAEPGVNPRRESANLLYGHIQQDCVIEVIDYSSVRSSFGRMANVEFVNFINNPEASAKESWVKVRWINIGGLSWDVVKALSIKYDLHPLALEDVFHARSQNRSKADYYSKHLFLRVLCHKLEDSDDSEFTSSDTPAHGHTLTGLHRSASPTPLEDGLEEDAMKEREDKDTMHPNGITQHNVKKRRHFLPRPLLPNSQHDVEARLMRGAAVSRQKRVEHEVTLDALKHGERVDVKVSPMFVFLLRDGTVISIHKDPSLEFTSPISKRLHQRDTGLRTSADPSLLVHAILDLIVDNALEVIDAYHTKINKFERAILMKPNVKTVRHLHILSGDLILHKRTLEPIKTMIYGLRRYDLDRCAALVDMSDPANANADVFDHMEYILTSLEMFAGIAENLIGYTFNGMNFSAMWSVDKHTDLLFWEIALPLMAVLIPMFMWSDIKSLAHYIQKRVSTHRALKHSAMLRLGFFLLCFALRVVANTEIVNIRVTETHDVEIPFTKDWSVETSHTAYKLDASRRPTLNHTHNDRQWTVLPAPYGTPLKQACEEQTPSTLDSRRHPCPHELWVLLDLTRDWSTHSSFTLRLSWPAPYPADFSIQIYDSEALLSRFGVKPEQPRHTSSALHAGQRYRFAHIRLVDTGVLTPTPKSYTDATKPAEAEPIPVPFILVLEPLYFGVLPPSVLPVLGFIALACVAAGLAVPKILDHLNSIAVQARKELAVNEKRE
ncbi:hypothetical protein D9615_001084 [Tricholomella constricta]|uniref:Uncharacterized protein n=1 Tax=Tricholomella constricta TaxID=117010 RepID=A0A8H5HKT6_9AGAR|nr:hypothetical protein D9615_001084 [Tricholomella constricta]